MTILYNGLNALPYTVNPVPLVYNTRAPTTTDYQGYSVGTQWIDKSTQDVWQLVSLGGTIAAPTFNQAIWVQITGGSGNILGITADNAVTAFPVAGLLNLFGNGTTLTTSASGNTLILNLSGSVATTFNGNTGTATPSAGALNILGTGSISTAATGSTVTISFTGPVAESWVEVTTTSQAMAANTGYVANNAALVTLTLPSAAVFGTRLTITGKGAGGWLIAQNSGQTIFFGTSTTTTGVGGSLSSTQTRDTIDLVCVTANTQWNVINSVGNITVT